MGINLGRKLRTGVECFVGLPLLVQSGMHRHLSMLVNVSTLLLNQKTRGVRIGVQGGSHFRSASEICDVASLLNYQLCTTLFD